MFVSNAVTAQRNDVGNWLIYFGNQKIAKRWNWHNEVQVRNFNFIGDLNQLLIRTGVGYNLSENNNNLLLGYGFIETHPKDDSATLGPVHEHRIFQQYIAKNRLGGLFAHHRIRLEQRLFNDDFRSRLRYFFSMSKPLNKKELESNAFYLSAYNEIFFNTKGNLFDRNRIYGGVGYCINKHLRVESGFMSQILANSNQSQLQIIFVNNLPLAD